MILHVRETLQPLQATSTSCRESGNAHALKELTFLKSLYSRQFFQIGPMINL